MIMTCPNFSNVLTLLQQLTNQTPSIIKSAEKSLRNEELKQGFHASLQDVILNKALPYDIRWMASRCLKDGIERFWRKSSRNCLGPEEKSQIRSKALLMLCEPNNTILIQVCLSLGRMARTDYPTDWPDLFESLFQFLSSSSHQLEQCESIIFAFYFIIKALTSQKIGVGRAHTEQVSPFILNSLYPFFFQNYSCLTLPRLLVYTLKCLRYLLVFGVKQIDKDAEPFLARLPEFFTFYYEHQQEKALTILGKLVLDFQERHGNKWVLYPGMMGVIQWHSNAILSKSSTLPTKVLIQSFAILKSAIKSASSYTSTDQSLERRKSNPQLNAQMSASESIITPDLIRSLLEVILLWHLRITSEQVETMNSDPLHFIIEEDKDHWEFTHKGYASRLLMEIVRDYPEVAFTYFTPLLHTFTTLPLLPFDQDTLISIVTGFTYIADQLHSALPFIPFLTHFLLPWIQSSSTTTTTPMTSILTSTATENNPNLTTPPSSSFFPLSSPSSPWIQRLVCQCIGAFVTVNVPRSERTVIYDCLSKLISTPHLLVQFAAVDALRKAVDDWDFDVGPFLPYLDHFIHCLIPLFLINEFEVQLKVAHCFSVLFERLDTHMVSFAPFLIDVLPKLWTQAMAGQEPMFQAALLNLTLKLVEALKSQCFVFHEFTAHLIDQSCDVTLPSALYLMEDGLALWYHMMSYATNPSTLVNQKRWLPSLLERGSEHLKLILNICVSYVLLDPSTFISTIGKNVIEVIANVLGPTPSSPFSSTTTTTTLTTSSTFNVDGTPSSSATSISSLRPIVSSMLVHALEWVLLTSPDFALKAFFNYGILSRMVYGLCSKTDHPLTLVSFLTLLSRVVLQVPSLDSFFNSLSPLNISSLLDPWLDRWDHLGHLHQRKLNLLALTRLCTSSLSHVPTLVPLWIQFLHEVHENKQGDAPIYWSMREALDDAFLLDFNANEEEMEAMAPEYHRKKQLLQCRDPVHCVSTLQSIQLTMESIAHQVGGQDRFLQMIPMELVSELNTFFS